MGSEESDAYIADLRRCLRLLSRGCGIYNPKLVGLLNGKLKLLTQVFGIDLGRDINATRKTIESALFGHIIQLAPRRARSGLPPDERLQQYQRVAKVGFNIDIGHQLDKSILQVRYDWLASKQRKPLDIDVRSARRDFKHAIDQIAARIAGGKDKPIAPTGRLVVDEAPAADENAITPEATLSERNPSLMERWNYMNQVLDAISSKRPMIICLWGEPGTGKTVLAQQVTQVLEMPYVMLRAGDPDILRGDITETLISEGLQPTNWTDTYSRAMLKRQLNGEIGPRSRNVIIIDNVDDEELIWQLVPKAPKGLILITMRSKPRSPDIQTVEIGDFTEEQACDFIRRQLIDADDTEVLALARVLGSRPLAIDHATRFIRESPDVSLCDLILTLVGSVTEGLGLVIEEADKRKHLIILYKSILAYVLERHDAGLLLDNFLAITGKSGINYLTGSLRFYTQSDAGGGLDRVRYRAGLRVLIPLGLIREAENGRLIIMHPLTYEILRDLRGSVPFEIEAQYALSFADPKTIERVSRDLTRESSEEVPEHAGGTGAAQAWLMGRVLEVSSQGLPEGWRLFHAIDDRTWLSVREATTNSGETQTYIVRYEVYPIGVYKLDYRTGQRSSLDRDEAQLLANMIYQYHNQVMQLLQEVQQEFAEEANRRERIGDASDSTSTES